MTKDSNNEINQDEVRIAMFEFETMLDRLGGMKWMVLNPTAKEMVEQRLVTPPLSFGVEIEEVTVERLDTIRTMFEDFEVTDAGLIGKVRGIPIVLRFIKLKYPFINNPGQIRYENEYYNIPNPFSDYDEVWKKIK